jgi:hypothetical protein
VLFYVTRFTSLSEPQITFMRSNGSANDTMERKWKDVCEGLIWDLCGYLLTVTEVACKVILVHVMKAMRNYSSFSNYMEDNGQIHASAALPPVKQPPIHSEGGRVGRRTAMDTSGTGKLLSVLEIEPRFRGCPSRNLVSIRTEESNQNVCYSRRQLSRNSKGNTTKFLEHCW